MTKKEAKDELSRHQQEFGCDHGWSSSVIKAMDIAIEALWKQIPNEVNYYGDGYADGNIVYDEAECPNCGTHFNDDEDTWESDFCPHCGKALKWEVDDGQTGSNRNS